ncbi:hypothetical protein BGX26_001846 [Mortierella sp. AD094]|nr:hypothetical protein BGX26_001846 [Mortierella sp. AD094]
MAIYAPTAAKDAPLEGEHVGGLASNQSQEGSMVSMDHTLNHSTGISSNNATALSSIQPYHHQSLSQPIDASFSATPKRLLAANNTSSHRRNQSHGHINFPKFSMPPNLVINSPFHDTHFNPLNPTARCSSVPTTPGAAQNHNTSSGSHTTAGAEKETYTLSDRTSTLVETTGQVPPPLIGSASVIHNNHLYLFGGRPSGGDPTNDLYILNLDTLVWTLVDQEQQQRICQQQTSDWNKGYEEDDGRLSPSVDALSRRESRVHPFSMRISLAEETFTQSSKTDLRALQWIPSGLNPRDTVVSAGSNQSASVGMDSKGEDSGRESTEPTCTNTEGGNPSTPASFPAQLSQVPIASAKQHNPYLFHTPEPRFAHVASITGDHMVIIGGQGFDNDYIHEISVLDLKRHIWMDGGKLPGSASQSRSSLASVDEKPMVRRRRRYLECLAAETLQHRPRPSSIISTISSSLPFSPNLTDVVTPSKEISPLSPASPGDMLSPLLNPRKNSWHRGEGHPFEISGSLPSIRQRFMSDTGLSSTIELDDYVWVTGGKQQDPSESTTTQELVGLGTDPDVHSVQDIATNVTQPSIASNSKSPHMAAPSAMPSNRSIMSSGSEKSRSRSQSSALSTPSTKPHPRAITIQHAVPKAFFSKSNGGLFELDSLATTIAREKKNSSSKGDDKSSKGSFSHDKPLQLRRSSSIGANSTSSRRSSGAVDDNMATRRLRREFESEDKAEKRRSLDSVLDSVSIFESSFAEGKFGTTESPRSQYIPTPYSQPLYMYSNYIIDDKLKRDFVKVQTAKGPYRPGTGRVSYEIRPEWTALDLGPGVLGGFEGQCPPKMYFPAAHIVDNCFVLSGTLVDDEREREIAESSSSLQSSKPLYAFMNNGPQNQLDIREPAASTSRRRSFSVWMHHFHSHQWTQLELSKSLRSGTWNQSVLDREGNLLYILGQRKDNPNYETPETQPRLSVGFETELDSPLAAVSFTHMIRVDLEGLEICPDIDESCVGPNGVRLGLDMLRDGVGADVVLVSSVDGGRVRVNSGIVGQRWGYFQALMEERDRIRDLEAEARKSMNTQSHIGGASGESESVKTSQDQREHAHGGQNNPNSQSKKWYLDDKPTEVMVRETTPILVGFLQYIYTNELVTPHQLKLKTLQGLLLVSHFYDLTRLQQLVRRAIYQQLNASNAAAICEVAVLTHEFGLQTRALRTLLQSARMAQMRRQGEAAEAKRRLDFAMSRLEEIEEDRKRKASMQANQILLQQGGSTSAGVTGSIYTNNSSDNITGGPISTATLRQGSIAFVNTGSATSGSGLGAIGRFFRHREESVESVGPFV